MLAQLNDLRHLQADVRILPGGQQLPDLLDRLVRGVVSTAVNSQYPLLVDGEDLTLAATPEQLITAGAE